MRERPQPVRSQGAARPRRVPCSPRGWPGASRTSCGPATRPLGLGRARLPNTVSGTTPGGEKLARRQTSLRGLERQRGSAGAAGSADQRVGGSRRRAWGRQLALPSRRPDASPLRAVPSLGPPKPSPGQTKGARPGTLPRLRSYLGKRGSAGPLAAAAAARPGVRGSPWRALRSLGWAQLRLGGAARLQGAEETDGTEGLRGELVKPSWKTPPLAATPPSRPPSSSPGACPPSSASPGRSRGPGLRPSPSFAASASSGNGAGPPGPESARNVS